jgi:hypothetical protein
MTQKNITTGVLIALVLATITFAIDLESEKKKIERIA